MRPFSLATLTVAFGVTLLASAPAEAQRRRRQAPTPEQLQERYDAKMAEKWWKNASWTTSYDEALKQSKASGKTIFAYFTRSYSP